MSYFKETYEEARQTFLGYAHDRGGDVRSHPVDEDAFESVYFPPTSGVKEKLVILTSGIHGIEGFTGSALQSYFLAKDFFGVKTETTGVLLIHGINAYGFKHRRRVTRRNVDLNRNFDVTEDLFQIKNPGYAKLYHFLNTPRSRITFYALAVYQILRHGIDNLRRAILRGQYQFEDGIFFGGKGFEPQVKLIRDEVLRVGEGYANVSLIDLHTGYGQRGKLHLFGDRSPYIDPTIMDEVFKVLPVDYGLEKDFYAVTGGFTVFIARLFHGKAKFAGVVFEFGTIDSQTTVGSLDSLYRMVTGEPELLSEMFYPTSHEWREGVIKQFETFFPR